MGGLGSGPGLGRSPGAGHGSPLQYSCLKNPSGQRNLAGYSSWVTELDMTEWLSTTQQSTLYSHLNFGIALYSGSAGKGSSCQCRRHQRWIQFLGREDPQRKKWQPTLAFLPRKCQAQRNLVGYSPWDPKESGTTECTCTQSLILLDEYYFSSSGTGLSKAIIQFVSLIIYWVHKSHLICL